MLPLRFAYLRSFRNCSFYPYNFASFSVATAPLPLLSFITYHLLIVVFSSSKFFFRIIFSPFSVITIFLIEYPEIISAAALTLYYNRYSNVLPNLLFKFLKTIFIILAICANNGIAFIYSLSSFASPLQ